MTPPELRVVRPVEGATGVPLEGRGDDELMVLAAGGLRAAFATLVGRYAQRLVQFCAKITGDAGRAEEMAQETWLHIWAARGSYVPNGRFAVFLFTTARNRCRNQLRDVRRLGRWQLPAGEGDEATSGVPDRLDEMLARERERRLHEALGSISIEHREAVVLRSGEGLSYDEIAAVVGASESTLRSRVHHAIKGLRRALQGGRP